MSPRKTGYTFSGWSDGANTYNSGDKFDMPASNVTLTAQWTAIDYSVTYDGNGSNGGVVPSDDTVYHYGDDVTVLTDMPTKTGYTFGGWSDGENTYEAEDTFDMPADNITLTAQWTVNDYTVTYSGNGSDGGTVPGDDNIYHYEDEVTVSLDKATKTGYTFGGWSDGTKTYHAGDTFAMPAQDITLMAQWTAVGYTLSYNGNGGAAPDATVYHYQDKVTVADKPTRKGYKFAGWSDGVTTYQAGDTFVMPADDITLTAQWQKNAVKAVTNDTTFATPTPTATAAPTTAPTPTTVPTSTAAPAGDAQTITMVPDVIEEDDGTYIIEISISDLPEGTTAIRAADGTTIAITGNEGTVRITVKKDDVDEDGSIELVALNDEGMPMGAYDVQVLQGDTLTMPDAQSAWDAFVDVLLWVIIGIVLAGAVVLVVIVVRKKNKEA